MGARAQNASRFAGSARARPRTLTIEPKWTCQGVVSLRNNVASARSSRRRTACVAYAWSQRPTFGNGMASTEATRSSARTAATSAGSQPAGPLQ